MQPSAELKERILLLLILAAAFFLMLWGINWGLPLKKGHIDEAVVIFYTMRFFTGDLNPHVFFDYPTLYLYILGAAYSVCFIIGKLFGLFQSLDQFVGIYLNGNASFLYIIGRLLSAAFGTGSVYLVYRIGREHFSGGLLPALAMALIPLNALYGHYAMVDTAAVFFLLASFLFMGRFLKTNLSPELMKGAFFLGLATATKYYPVVFFFPLLLFLALKKNRAALPAAGMLALGFAAGCPFSVLDFRSFFARFADRFQYLIWGDSVSTNSGLMHNLLLSLKAASGIFTLPLLILLSAGIIAYLYKFRKERTLILWVISPLLYLLFLLSWNVISPHYLLPVIPFVLLTGIRGLETLKIPSKLAAVIVICFCLMPAYKTVKMDIQLGREDTRLTAYKWITANLPANSRILRLPNTPEFANTDPFRVTVDWEGKMHAAPVERIAGEFDYVITSAFSGTPAGEWEKSLAKYYRIEKHWDYIPLAPFHFPAITVYARARGKN